MQRSLPFRVLLVAGFSACGFAIATMDTDDTGTGEDMTPADAFEAPDASVCGDPTAKECVGPVLRACSATGQLPMDTTCAWGCSSLGTPHCAQLMPSGGAVTPADLNPEGLTDVTLQNARINTDTGEIQPGRPAGTGIQSGIDWRVQNGVGIFRFRSLTVKGQLAGTGANALALVSATSVTVQGVIDIQGDCSNRSAGPGGHVGAARGADAIGPGAGRKGDQQNNAGPGGGDGCSGAGGGGNGTSGGAGGGKSNAGAAFYSSSMPVSLVGGGGGGGGGGDSGGDGGGGGGALQIVANGPVKITGANPIELYGILAGGCGGQGARDCGGGGGAGGSVLIEAPTVELDSCVISVNGGGGGGGGESNGQQRPGKNGLSAFNSSVIVGGGGSSGGNGGGGGGNGGIRNSLVGRGGQDATNGGAGGGGVGRIRFHTYSGQVSISGASLTPSLTESNTTTTRSTASVQ